MSSADTVSIFGMSLATYTLLHTLISLVGIGSGLVVLFGLFWGKRLDAWTGVFLATTVATSATGFGFPFHELLPSHVVGLISLAVLAVAIVARYRFHLRGGWRKVYVISAVLALYLNVFVLVVQAFLKVPALNALAPKQTEPPFAVSQGIALLLFVVAGILAATRFRAEAGPGQPSPAK
jgi:glucose-6-phosphate-specific signal transduction histidine kinase